MFLIDAIRHSRMVCRIDLAALALIAGRKLTKNFPQRFFALRLLRDHIELRPDLAPLLPGPFRVARGACATLATWMPWRAMEKLLERYPLPAPATLAKNDPGLLARNGPPISRPRSAVFNAEVPATAVVPILLVGLAVSDRSMVVGPSQQARRRVVGARQQQRRRETRAAHYERQLNPRRALRSTIDPNPHPLTAIR
jgi:hypothetical protein